MSERATIEITPSRTADVGGVAVRRALPTRGRSIPAVALTAYAVPATIDDPISLDEIAAALSSLGYPKPAPVSDR